MDNAIITKESVNALTNKEIKKNLTTMSNAVLNGNKASWTYAFALDNIVKGEQFVDDFKTVTAFAKFINSTKGGVSQITNAVAFVKRADLVEYTEKHKPILDTIPCTVGLAYVYSTLSSEDFINFKIWLWESYEIDNVYTLSIREAKRLIKEFTEPETEEPETEEPETEEPETSTEVSRDDIIANIKALIKEYGITEEELF